VRVHSPGHRASDDAFSIEPGGERRVELRRVATVGGSVNRVTLTALNLADSLTIEPT
jgi:hypothetical protein